MPAASSAAAAELQPLLQHQSRADPDPECGHAAGSEDDMRPSAAGGAGRPPSPARCLAAGLCFAVGSVALYCEALHRSGGAPIVGVGVFSNREHAGGSSSREHAGQVAENSVPWWASAAILVVASVWAMLFTAVVCCSIWSGVGFGWGHFLYIRDHVYLTFRADSRDKRIRALEWIHVADWTPQNYRKYKDEMAKTQVCTPVPFVPPENIKYYEELFGKSGTAPPSPAGSPMDNSVLLSPAEISSVTFSGMCGSWLAASGPPPQSSDPQAPDDTVLWPVAPFGSASRLHELEKRLHDYVALRSEVLCRRAGLSKWIHSLEDKLKELRDPGESEKTQPAEKDPAGAPAPGSGNEVSGTGKVERKIRKYEEKITNGVRRLGTREILWEFYPENRLEHDEHKGRNRGTRENTSYFYNKYQNFFQDPEVKDLLGMDCCRRADGANSVTSKVDRDWFQQVLARSPVLSLRIQCDAYHAEAKKLRAAGKSVSASDRWRKAADEYFRNEDEAVNKEFPPEPKDPDPKKGDKDPDPKKCDADCSRPPRSGFMKDQRQRRKKTLTEGDRLRVAAPFRDLRTNLHWFRPGQTGTFHKYGGNTATERGFIKVTWDDLDLDDKQQQWIHPQNWVYLEQLGKYQEAHEDWALRYLANAPKATYSPGDIVTQETGPGWSMRRVYLSRSNLTEGGARHEIVRRLDAATVFTMRWWVKVTYFWLLLCLLVALATFFPVWLQRIGQMPRAVNYAPAESHHLADIVYSADKMCHQYGIVAMPMIAGAVKIVVFHFAVVYFLGSASHSGVMDPDWWAGMWEHPVFLSFVLKAAEEAEGKLSKERVKELNALYRCGWISKALVGNVVAVVFATLQIVSFVLTLVSVAQRIWRDEMQVATTWETYEAVLMLVCLNPSTLSLAQLLFRLRSTAEDGSLQRKYYYAGLGLLCIVGVPAFLTHAGPALVLVAGALIVFPLILPFVVVMDYTAPAVMPPGFLDTVRDDILGMLAIVGAIVICVIVASFVYGVLFWVLYIIVAAVRGTFCTLTGGESFTEVRDRILEADRNHKKWSVPAGFILRIQEESKFKGQFGWYVRNKLAGLHAEHDGRCCSADPYVGKSPVWLFQNGRTCWLQAGIFKIAEQPNVFWALLCLLPAKFGNGLPEALAQVGKATLASFLLQSLVVYMILWYHGETLNKVPEEEFNARNFDVYVQCVLAKFWVEWHRGLQVLGCF
eukprot:TRINITY_DN3349_c0_g1_i6.p1 TRINITY_DN3349_c0_g1~~TRINITY_DN3349_c0_g1_i6.p1  ORF type:complete len:1238 (+),score=228.49 TRINITY_DN3349_c0_g1_i6:83-3715(+)